MSEYLIHLQSGKTDPLSLPVQITDALSGISNSTVQLDKTITDNPIKAAPAALAIGNHGIEITGTDLAGNVTASTYKVQIDTNLRHRLLHSKCQ
ncbi:hypothetical protein [Paenibacillus sp. yr247]|uniref:hypothetical protein n=1 Tax=Paenibacillus sp. yr247 TaxID=1761880 RepID=UPI001C316E75|nr:hypothetical protein [Paenibacillus sp. yr247]